MARPRSEEHTPADRSLSMRTPFQMIRHVLVAGASYYNSMFSTPCACHENRWLEKEKKRCLIILSAFSIDYEDFKMLLLYSVGALVAEIFPILI